MNNLMLLTALLLIVEAGFGGACLLLCKRYVRFAMMDVLPSVMNEVKAASVRHSENLRAVAESLKRMEDPYEVTDFVVLSSPKTVVVTFTGTVAGEKETLYVEKSVRLTPEVAAQLSRALKPENKDKHHA